MLVQYQKELRFFLNNYEKIRKVGRLQEQVYNETGQAPDELGLLKFNYGDKTIINPFKSECGRLEVDAGSYYKNVFFESDFVNEEKLNKMLEKLEKKDF